jgi:hypothetical protein
MSTNKLTVRQRLWQWVIIAVSNQLFLSICFRDKRYSRKEPDGITERYSTIERAIVCIFHTITILMIFITFGMVLGVYNVNCVLSTSALNDCLRDRSDNSSCIIHINGTFVSPTNYTVPESKRLTFGSKHKHFLDRNGLNPKWYFVFRLQYNGTEALHYSQFVKHSKSYVCVVSTDETDKLYCMHPTELCNVYTKPPKKHDPTATKKYIIIQLIVTSITQLTIWTFVSPLSNFLMFLFIGFCEPKRGSRLRVIYRIFAWSISAIAILVMLTWIFIALVLTFHYFIQLDRNTKATAIGMSFGSWVGVVFVGDTIGSFIGGLINFRKVVCFGIPVDGDEENESESQELMLQVFSESSGSTDSPSSDSSSCNNYIQNENV